MRAAWLVLRAIERLRPQMQSLRISTNRNLDRYSAFGHPVFPDDVAFANVEYGSLSE